MNNPVFFARSNQLNKLWSHFEFVEQGNFSLLFVTGESGTGKTALVNEFVQQLRLKQKIFNYSSGFSNPHSGHGEPYLPFRHALCSLFENVSAGNREEKKTKMHEVTKGVFRALLACAPDIIENFVPGGTIINKLGEHIAGEFDLFNKNKDNPQTGPRELQESQIFEQYTQLLKSLSNDKPALLVLDDMHWCDKASANLLFHLARSLKQSKIMLLCIYQSSAVIIDRNKEKHPLEPVLNEIKKNFGNVWIDLNLVSSEERNELVSALIDAEPNQLSKSFREALLLHTDGHALFASELLKSMKENGSLARNETGNWIETDKLNWRSNPERIEGVLENRLGQLENSLMEILNIASIQGHHFILQVIARLQQTNERESLQGWGRELSKKHQLIAEGKTIRNGASLLSFFRFSSSVFQQYLYNQMGEGERMLLHGDVATILEEIYKGKEDEILFDLAKHYDLALIPEKAVPFIYRAGRKALKLGAYTEARMHFTRASELIHQLPVTAESQKLQADIWLYLSQTIRVMEGWNSPLAKELYQKVLEFYKSTEEKDKLLVVFFGLWTIALVNAQLDKALETAHAMQELVCQLSDPIAIIQVNIALGNTLFWLGNLRAIAQIDEKLQDHMNASDSEEFLLRNGYEASAIANQFRSWTMVLQGKDKFGETLCTDSLQKSEKLNHAFSQVLTCNGAVFFYFLLHNPDKTLLYSNKMLGIADENNFESYKGIALMFRQWAQVQLGQSDSVAEIETGYGLWVKHSGVLAATLYHCLKADCLLRTGQTTTAAVELQDGIGIADQTGEKVLKGILLNMLAKLMCDNNDLQSGCMYYLQANAIACEQGATYIQKRSLECLADIYRKQGNVCELNRIEAELLQLQ